MTLSLSFGLALLFGAQNGGPVDFARDVRPLLSDRCFPCHGPDEAARRFTGGLRLDTAEGAGADLGGYAAVVPGDVPASELMLRVRAGDPLDRMPPVDSKLELAPEEIEILERWIEQGAEYRAHWAFSAPRRREPPADRGDGWARDELDRWVLDALEREGLKPAEEATRVTWLRRVRFDLTGLPPTLEELDAFLADDREDAHARVVERLLASPAHAERMAADWLDLARYADTWGYQNDVGREVWRWRDWVIGAFDRDLAYDDFVTWQLAGDLLPNPTEDQRLATAFNRLHRMTNEGGSVEEEFRVESVADRVHTFGTAFLGLTFECARCHDHKFDPISTEDYYGLFAFFQNIDEAGLYSHFTRATPTPALELATEEQAASIARLQALITERRAALRSHTAADEAGFAEWLAQGEALLTLPDEEGRYAFESTAEGVLVNELDPEAPGKAAAELVLVRGRDGLALQFPGDAPASFPGVGELTRDDPFTIAVWLRLSDVKQRAVVWHRSRAWTDAASQGYQLLLEDGRPSAALIHFWPGDALCVRALEPLPIAEWVHVAVTYDGSSRAEGLRIFVDGEPAAALVVRDGLRHAITGGGPPAFTIGERFRDRGLSGGAVDELRVFERELAPLEVATLHDPALATRFDSARAASWSAREYAAAREAWIAATRHRDERVALREVRRELSAVRDAVERIVTMEELPTRREARVLTRGAYDRRGELVQPSTPRAVLPFSSELPPDRAGLARWLFDPEHPLTARVAANRLWQIAFGRGLVASPENFGSQGTPPTHTELLDALALDLLESGWDLDALLARLVLSSTYRQSSRADARKLRDDPDNRWLARAPRFRLPAEMLRDAALAASGLLAREVGGPSVKPYQPSGLWQEKSGLHYERQLGAGSHRRSLYTYWKRTSPPPAMMLFDASKRDVCVARRSSTTTPLQTLVLWNDPQFVEAARGLAARAIEEAGGEAANWIPHAFRLATARRPDPTELSLLVDGWETEYARFQSAPERALELLTVGDLPVAEGVDAPALAAGALIASVIFSSDAFLTRR